MKIKLLIGGLMVLVSCAKAPDLGPVPELEFTGMSKMKMKAGSVNQDSIILTVKLTDGDGDIGYEDVQERKPDMFIIDKRTGNLYDTYIIPGIPQQGINNGIIANMQIKLYTVCCTLNPCDPDPGQADEALPLELYVKDRAGNVSNTLQLSAVLDCD
ncbi:MAG: hypothetical protein IPN29_13060 [Saprospiraceae bacterium]|nr:hypothetical protein [Saprospiraceae bacterium]